MKNDLNNVLEESIKKLQIIKEWKFINWDEKITKSIKEFSNNKHDQCLFVIQLLNCSYDLAAKIIKKFDEIELSTLKKCLDLIIKDQIKYNESH